MAHDRGNTYHSSTQLPDSLSVLTLLIISGATMLAFDHGHDPRGDYSATIPDRTLVLTVGLPPSGDVEGILTTGDVSFSSIPHFGPLVAALTAVGAGHQPVNIRYRLNAPFVLSYADCSLQDVSHLSLLQLLVGSPTLITLQLRVPLFGPETLPTLDAPYLTTLILSGELPCIYQFLHAIRTPALESLQLSFHRSQWDKLDTLEDPTRYPAYSLALPPTSFPALHTVQVAETELAPRWSYVSFGCAFRPFMYIPTLEDVKVLLDASPLWVSNDDLARVAVVWPELRRLVLACTKVVKRAPTLDALGHLQMACRNLTELVLPKIKLNEPDIPAHVMPLDNAHPRNHPLRTLRLTCQTGSKVSADYCVEVGWRISQLFPNLDLYTASTMDPVTDSFSKWDAIRMGILDATAMRDSHMLSML